jgi:hypothetical protein
MGRTMRKIAGNSKSVDWKTVTNLQGNVSDRRTVEIAGKQRRCMTLSTENGELFTIWESAGLMPLFNLPQDGIYVEIRNLGLRTTKKGEMRLFDIAIDDGQLEFPFGE